MADSVVSIWNRALSRCGVTTQVADEMEDTVEAGICRVHWSELLDEVLEDYPWPFAKRQAVLAELSAVTRVGWEHVYALPADFIAARAILSGETRPGLLPSENRTPYEIVADDAAEGRVLCCDVDPDDFDALEYTGRVTNPGAYPASFSCAIGWKLAAELTVAIEKNTAKAQGFLQMYELEVRKSFSAALRSNHDDLPLEGSGIRARS